MRDDPQSPEHDGRFIALDEPYEIRDWARNLNTTPERIREAVLAVGDSVRKVEEYLSGRRAGAGN